MMYNIFETDQENETKLDKNLLSDESEYKNRLSYWKTPGVEPLKNYTIGELVGRTAALYGDREGIVSIHQGQRMTFKQIHKKTNDLAAGLLAIGLKKGNHVALWGSNTLEWYLTYLACSKAGFVVMNLNPHYESREMKFCLSKMDANALIMDESFNDMQYYKILQTLVPEITKAQSGCPFKSAELPLLTKVVIISEKCYPGTYRWKDVMKVGTNMPNSELCNVVNLIRAHDVCNIQFTSGTTGNPKGALLTHHNVVNNSCYAAKRMRLCEKENKLCLHVPLFHTFGTVLGILIALHGGTTIVLPSAKFSPRKSIQTIIEEKCTVVYGTPTMYIDIITIAKQLSKTDPLIYKKMASLDIAFSAGSVCPPELFRSMKSILNISKIFSGYGMTEASPLVFMSQHTDSEYQITSTIGFVCEHIEVKVVDENNEMVPLGTPGEVLFKGYNVMKGYYNDPEETKKAIQSGWLRSGDKFVLLENGYGQVVGRIKDTIIRGGENIEPSEIENILLQHRDIINAQVYGVYDKRLGETVAVDIVKEENSNLDEEEIRRFCRGKFASYKIPKYINFVFDYPRTASGKIQKFQLRKNLEEKLKLRE